VKAWKHVARNVALSLHKGDPVVVTGRLSLDEWDGPDGPRTSLVVEATALGPDLTLGEARFARTVHRREDDGARRDHAAGATGDGAHARDRRAGAPGSSAHDAPALDDPWTLADVGTALAGEDGDPSGDDPAPDAADRAATGREDVAADEPVGV